MAGTSSIFKKSPQDYREPTFEEFREATRLHAIGTEWEYISDKLGVPVEELMTWPERYPADWERFVKDTERQFFRQALSEGMAGARRLVYDKDPKIALEAAKALLNYVKTHERVVLEELKEMNRRERESKKLKKESHENVEKVENVEHQQSEPNFCEYVVLASNSGDNAENNHTSANTTLQLPSPTPAEASPISDQALPTSTRPRQPNASPTDPSPQTIPVITPHESTCHQNRSPRSTECCGETKEPCN
jgi:hypothetical protein